MRRAVERENTGRMEAGQDLVAVGYAGAWGAARIAGEKGEQLKCRFSPGYLREAVFRREAPLPSDISFWEEMGAVEYEPAGEGGILTALWILSGAYGLGIEFSLRAIPLRQETVEICEEFGLNPYRLYSRDCGVLAAPNGGRLAERLQREGIPAAVIGRVKRGIAREILSEEGVAYLERPREDEMWKVLPEIPDVEKS